MYVNCIQSPFDMDHTAARMLLFAAFQVFLLLFLFCRCWNGLGCQSSGWCLFVWKHCIELDNLAKYTENFINDNKDWMRLSTNNNNNEYTHCANGTVHTKSCFGIWLIISIIAQYSPSQAVTQNLNTWSIRRNWFHNGNFVWLVMISVEIF